MKIPLNNTKRAIAMSRPVHWLPHWLIYQPPDHPLYRPVHWLSYWPSYQLPYHPPYRPVYWLLYWLPHWLIYQPSDQLPYRPVHWLSYWPSYQLPYHPPYRPVYWLLYWPRYQSPDRLINHVAYCQWDQPLLQMWKVCLAGPSWRGACRPLL